MKKLVHSEAQRVLVGVLAAVAAIAVSRLPSLQALEHYMYDARVRMASRLAAPDPDIVLVVIDDASLKALEPALGRWPWPRAVISSVLDYCGKARVIGLDVLFAERDTRFAESDQLFVDVVARNSNVVVATVLGGAVTDRSVWERLEPHAVDGVRADQTEAQAFSTALLPFDSLLDAAVDVGFVNAFAEDDGVVRRHVALARVGDYLLPSLPLAMARQLDPRARATLTQSENGDLGLGSSTVALDREGAFAFYPTSWSYPTYSIMDIVQAWQKESAGEVPAIGREDFRNKIVLIGSVATGLLRDEQKTSISVRAPGVHLVADALSNIIAGRSLWNLGPPWTFLLTLLMALLPASRRIATPTLLAIVAVLFFGIYQIAVFGALVLHGLVLPVTAPVTGLFGSTLTLGMLLWYSERRTNRTMREVEQARARFTDMLVHDLRNAIAPIVMNVSYMRSLDGPQDDEMTESLLAIEDGSNQLLCRVDTLLDISRLRHGRLQLKLEARNLVELLKPVAERYRLSAERAGVELDFIAGGEGLKVAVDSELFVRVAENLLWNAIKYATRETRILLQVDRNADGRPQFSIANRCPALGEQAKSRIFLMFETAEPVGKLGHQFTASGIGLTFTRLIVEAHGGSIKLDSPCVEFGDEGVKITAAFPLVAGEGPALDTNVVEAR